MNTNIGILGGDLRNIKLSTLLLKQGYKVYTYGLENIDFFKKDIISTKDIEKLFNKCDIIISGIPFSTNGKDINAPFSKSKIPVEKVLKLLKNKRLIAGGIKTKIPDSVEVLDLMEKEEFVVLNIIPTVEGAIQTAMQNTENTVHNSNCMVLGFGRIGKLLCKYLNSMGANVSCVARKDKDLAWIKLLKYNCININDLNKNLENKYDIIFNTIPSQIIDKYKLNILRENNSDVLIIDLASYPWGVDFEVAEQYNIKTIKAQGLPGKVAPNTSAKYIVETLKNYNLI